MRSAKLLAFLTAICLASAALAADYSGDYQGAKLSAKFNLAPDGSYVGNLQLDGQSFPCKAHEQNGQLAGTFNSRGNNYPFTAQLTGDHLTLTSGGTAYEMDRPPSGNPLTNPQPAPNPLGASAAAPDDFNLAASIGTGQILTLTKPDAKNIQDLLRSTLADLSKTFDAKPAVTGAFADKDGTRGGGASFTANLHGHPCKGNILVSMADGAASITILYDRADAPPAEWQALLAAIPSLPKMTDYQFPDNSGTIKLADGWTTQNQSVVGGITITGPDQQNVTIGKGTEVVTPDSPAVMIHNQLANNAAQFGGPPPPPLLIAPYCKPVDALTALIPQLSAMSQQNGGPALAVDQILQTTPAIASIPGGTASLILYSSTLTQNGQTIHYRSLAQIETYMIGPGTWGLFFTALAAPDDHFDKDLPVMLAMTQSFKCNDQVVQQITQNTIQQNNQRFAAFQEAEKEKNDAFESYQQTMKNNSDAMSRSNADFDEILHGYRTVYDTETGNKNEVDLGEVHGVVNALNESDPGRYVEIPLRDQQ